MVGEHPRHELDEVIQTPVRFSIMATLSGVGEAEFSFVRDTVEVSEGEGENLKWARVVKEGNIKVDG